MLLVKQIIWGKTLYNLFKIFNKENLAQLYFHILEPEVNICKTMFQISDIEALKSIIRFKTCGKEIEFKNVISSGNKLNKKIYKYGNKRTDFKNLARDFMWNLSGWNSKNLKKWIEEYNPNVVFFVAGYSMFSFDIAMNISSRYNLPLVTYFCDDYYNYKFNSNKNLLVSNLRMKLFNNKMNQIISKSKSLIFISQSMNEKYYNLFKKRGNVIMTPYSFSQNKVKSNNNYLIMSYIGGVLGNRWVTLNKIGQELNNINSNGKKIVLHIYSMVDDEKIISNLNIGTSMVFKGSADFELVKKGSFRIRYLITCRIFCK